MRVKKKYFMLSAYVKTARDNGEINPNELVEALEHYIALFKDMKKQYRAADRAKLLHDIIDIKIAKERAKDNSDTTRQITCRKNCAFCCYQNVDVTYDEAALLIDTYPIDWSAVELQAKNESPRSQRCVFLQSDNSCGVYENRPTSCRKYFVVSNPSDCNMDDASNSGLVEVCGINDAEIMASAIMTASDCDSMATMLLKVRNSK